jgi:hypothetical protein
MLRIISRRLSNINKSCINKICDNKKLCKELGICYYTDNISGIGPGFDNNGDFGFGIKSGIPSINIINIDTCKNNKPLSTDKDNSNTIFTLFNTDSNSDSDSN